MAPKKINQKELKEAQAATSEWSISKCSRHHLANLVLGVCFKREISSIGALPFAILS
jgi:hypothetical protein